MRETPQGADPLGPDNALVFASSVMAGQPYVGLASFALCGKSPLTGGMGETHCEGPFGFALKGSGFDAIVIKGASATPVALVIDEADADLAVEVDRVGLRPVVVPTVMSQPGVAAALARRCLDEVVAS